MSAHRTWHARPGSFALRWDVAKEERARRARLLASLVALGNVGVCVAGWLLVNKMEEGT
jgi:hypothetical protein